MPALTSMHRALGRCHSISRTNLKTLRAQSHRRASALLNWSVLFIALVFLASAAMPVSAQTFTLLANFTGTNGAAVDNEPLVQGFDGNLYGTASTGGTNAQGTVFQITPDGTFTTLYNFCSQPNCADGENPDGRLVAARDGNLYGVTLSGGTHMNGTVFKITTHGGLSTLYNFCGQSCGDGAAPAGLLQSADGNFYGTTVNGGSANHGTVFKMTAKGVLTTLYSFCTAAGCPDGIDPVAGLVRAADGNFYGTTNGAAIFRSTFFRITFTGKLTTLYTFCLTASCPDGTSNIGELVQGPDGALYGTNTSGGAGAGTVYAITTKGVLTTLYTFCAKAKCPDGSVPQSGLILATDGNLYGTTSEGGNFGIGHHCGAFCGTVFQITPAAAFTTEYRFCSVKICPDGAHPFSALLQATDGNLYGVTNLGGTKNHGTAFKLDVGLAPFVKPLTIAGKAGASVIILGMNLTGSTAVDFNGTPATFKVVSDGEITAKVPTGATTGKITVTTPSATLTSDVVFMVP